MHTRHFSIRIIMITAKLIKKISILFFISSVAYSNSVDTTKPNNDKPTVLEQQVISKSKAEMYPNIVNLYRPNYVLPYYNTHRPYQSIYINETPNNQLLDNEELKAQFSFLIPIFHHLIKDKPLALNFAYTQLMYWQVYAKSQYFRETNYEPELFVENYFNPYVAMQLGVSHQSNGRGGYLERSWNRAYVQLKFSGKDWLTMLRGWTLMAEDESSNLHNPDIAYYLGYENILFAYKFGDLKTSIEAQNIESGFKRGFVQATVSYPILKSISLYAQFFNGYGQSLIEYNHRCTSAGIGLAINDWIN